MRQCSKTSCQSAAVATLTYNYADSTVVLGPMSQRAEPHTYDLCEKHSRSMTAPKGWELLRLQAPESAEPPAPTEPDDLLALAHAVQEPGEGNEAPVDSGGSGGSGHHGGHTGSVSAPPSRPRISRGTEPNTGPRPDSLGSVNGESSARPGRPTLRLLRD
ncbi:DUF3499 domain-containing protein [Citricoccus sp. GCM10030269]|uniref:DUF3499 domain-containing protein n=1 Tax=Citricoccus sp. GCM10030269 TaxID=3273388 RepID=UPI00362452CF